MFRQLGLKLPRFILARHHSLQNSEGYDFILNCHENDGNHEIHSLGVAEGLVDLCIGCEHIEDRVLAGLKRQLKLIIAESA